MLAVLTLTVFMSQTVYAAKQKVSVKLKSPKNGAVVNITNPTVKKWWNNYTAFSSVKYNEVKELAKPSPVVFKWKGAKGCNYKFSLSLKKSMKKSRVINTKKCSVKVYNLLRNTKYYWRVTAIGAKKTVKSKIRSVKTNDITRTIYAPGVHNMRDLGGYMTASGTRTKQGLLYRCANLDKIKADGKKVLVKELGIKTDLDLRKEGEGTVGTTSPALKNYLHRRGAKYEDIIGDNDARERFVQGVKVFADKNNYPMLFHCTYGRDRTGTLAFIINGLLGVSKKNLYRDYELTFLTNKGSHTPEKYVESFDSFYKRMASYKDKSQPLSYNIEAYLLDAGMTITEIKNIKSILS